MSEISPTEACLCVFNLLCPYDKQLPKDEGKEIIDKIYGDAWQSAMKKPMEERI